MALYKLKIFLANGKSIAPYQYRILQEIDCAFQNSLNARNPKELKKRYYDSVVDCVVTEIFSKAVLSSPGHLLSNVSKSLLKKEDDEICKKLCLELLGKRLFRIDSEDITEESSKHNVSITDCEFLQIIASLLLNETDIKEKHQNKEIVKELKNVLVENQYIVSKFGLEE